MITSRDKKSSLQEKGKNLLPTKSYIYMRTVWGEGSSCDVLETPIGNSEMRMKREMEYIMTSTINTLNTTAPATTTRVVFGPNTPYFETMLEHHFVNKTKLSITPTKEEGHIEYWTFEVPGEVIWKTGPYGHKYLTSEGFMVTHGSNRAGNGTIRITSLGRNGGHDPEAALLFIDMMKKGPDSLPFEVTTPDPKEDWGVWIEWIDSQTGHPTGQIDRFPSFHLLAEAPEGLWIPEDTTPEMRWVRLPWYPSGTARVRLAVGPPEWWVKYVEARNAYYRHVGKPNELTGV